MAEYSVSLKSSAKRELARLPEEAISRIFPKIEALAADPRPHGCKKLRGSRDVWRIRIGDYRVVYTIEDTAKQIEVTRIAHRRDVYEP